MPDFFSRLRRLNLSDEIVHRAVTARIFCAFVLLLFALVWTNPQALGSHWPVDRVFNSMLDHLLRGKFDVDPDVVLSEGFRRGGQVFAYWGIMPALLRLPLTLLPEWQLRDATTLYCMMALFGMYIVKMGTVRYILNRNPQIPGYLGLIFYLVIAFSGAQLSFVKFSVYQEVCLWAGLFGAVFVAAAVIGQQHGVLGTREKTVMAAAAGAALLTRVSTGVGLIAAFGGAMIVELVRHRTAWREQARQGALPVLILLLAIISTGWVNYMRWGNPLIFADYSYYIGNADFPDRITRTQTYGLFNFARLPFGLSYYFFPVWAVEGQDGRLLFDSFRTRLIDSAELPPASFFLTDPLLLLLGAMAVAGWRRQRWSEMGRSLALALGLSLPPLFMLTAISMCFRYRMDFYPLIEFLAFSGMIALGRGHMRVRPKLFAALAAVSIVGTITTSLLAIKSPYGPVQISAPKGVAAFYADTFRQN